MTTLPSFAHWPKKILARENTIIAPWRQLSRSKSLPQKTHHLTLCGPVAPKTDSDALDELRHLSVSGLLDPTQFHGVEKEPAFHRSNLAAVKTMPASKRPLLHHGDIVRVLDDGLRTKQISPSILNLDTLHGPRQALSMLANSITLLNQCRNFVMVVWNVIIESRFHHQVNRRPELDEALRDPKLNLFLEEGHWHRYSWPKNNIYTYDGTGPDSKHTMTTLVWWKAAS